MGATTFKTSTEAEDAVETLAAVLQSAYATSIGEEEGAAEFEEFHIAGRSLLVGNYQYLEWWSGRKPHDHYLWCCSSLHLELYGDPVETWAVFSFATPVEAGTWGTIKALYR